MRCTRTSVTLTPALLLSAFSLAAVTAHAQVYVPNNTTLNSMLPNNTPPQAIIGFANGTDLNNHQNGTSPTVNVVNGFYANNADTTINTFNNSTLNIYGGIISFLYANDNSTVNLFSSAQTLFYIQAASSSTINFYGTAFSIVPITSNPQNPFQTYMLDVTFVNGSRIRTNALFVQPPGPFGPGAKITFTAVPEPGNIALLIGLGVSGATLFARRCRRTSNAV